MNSWRFRPSKPAALLSTVVGIAMLVLALTSFKHGGVFLVVWCAIVVAAIAFNMWAAFSPRGSLYEARGDGESPPGRFGMRAESERESAGRR